MNAALAPDIERRLAIELRPIESLTGLEASWRDLETRADASFFLSWNWIGPWLETSGAIPYVVAARLEGRLVGLGLANLAARRRAGLAWPTLALNEVGDARSDGIMIEDNGFLAERGLEKPVTAACLRHLVENLPRWRELRLGGVTETVAEIARKSGLSLRVRSRQPSFDIELESASEADTLPSLGRNTRQQINRSLALYRKRGIVEIIPSSSLDDALARFAALETLHQQRWQAKGKSGAFAEPYFARFHHALLTRCFPAGAADILRIRAGAETIGLLYCFFHKGAAYSYQNGFLYEQDAKLKPGLVSHYLAIDFCRRRGFARYRLLAGDSRYKRSLATSSSPLYWMTLRRDHWTVRFEDFARRVAGRGG